MNDLSVVLIHGFWSSAHTWRPIVDRLSADRRLESVGIRPFEYSSPKLPPLPCARTRIPDYEDIAQSFAAFYGLDPSPRVAIVTHSQGGLVLQRFLAWMLSEGRARELSRVRLVVMLSCPNEGSEYLRSIRAAAGFRRHPQARELAVLSERAADARRVVLRQVVNASALDERQCPIPFHVYSGAIDNVVRRGSAQSAFPRVGTLPGGHSTILDPAFPGSLTVPTLTRHVLDVLAEDDDEAGKPPAAALAVDDAASSGRPGEGAPERMPAASGTIGGGPEDGERGSTTEPGVRRQPVALLLNASWDEGLLRHVCAAMRRMGLQPRLSVDLRRADDLADRRLAAEVRGAIVVVAPAGTPERAVATAVRHRRRVIVLDGGDAERRSDNPVALALPAGASASAVVAALEDVVPDIVVAASEHVHEVARRMIGSAAFQPDKFFDLPMDVVGDGDEWIARGVADVDDAVFPELVVQGSPIRAVVTGLPGSGKSVLLSRLATWLAKPVAAPSAVAREIPVVPLWLRPSDLQAITDKYVHEPLTATTLWDEVSARVDAVVEETSATTRLTCDWLRSAGRLWLLVDGVDEYGSRNPEGLSQLIPGLVDLSSQGVPFTVACRTGFWEEQVRGRLHVNRRILIKPLDMRAARHLLEDVPLPAAARDPDSGDLAPWLLSPLLVRFLRQLRSDPGPLGDATRSRTAVYQAWSQWVAGQARSKGLHADFERLCEDVALEFVRQRQFELDASAVLGRVNLRGSTAGGLTTLAQLDALEVFDRSSSVTSVTNQATLGRSSAAGRPPRKDRPALASPLRFQHETMLEFFAVQALSADFTGALDPSRTHGELADMRLARVTLDHFQSSVYGFVDEMLEPSGYRASLVRWLGDVVVHDMPQLLLRNLIEYLGLTVRSDDASPVARRLCGLVADDSLTPLLRYTAARALERSHPAAPHPYYEYVSDWGTTDFATFIGRQVTREDEGPWVMRGWRSKEAACRRYLTFAPNDPTVSVDQELREAISGRLLDTLERLIQRSSPEESPVRVNVSLALVRWNDPAHAGRVRELVERGRVLGCEEEVLENLSRWVNYWN